ncbi:MAG: hypothetical protein D6675_14290 [Gemmatimonadetes bacterium]|nr:MAG: hypothetical protein D6675_14290 [Gemmatimonadota bacterium]
MINHTPYTLATSKQVGLGIFLLCWLVFVGTAGSWPFDFDTADGIDTFNGTTYIDTDAGELMISAPPVILTDGEGGTPFADTLSGANASRVTVRPELIHLKNIDIFTEDFTTTQYRGEATTALWVTRRGGGITLQFAEGNWRPQESGSIRDFNDIEFISKDIGWVAGGNAATPAMYKTTDGGATWTNITASLPPGTSELQDIDFSSSSMLAVGGGISGTIIISEDRGETWIRLNRPVDADGDSLFDITSVDFIDRMEGWVSAEYGHIFHTTDGGQTWVDQLEGVDRDINDLVFIDHQQGWAFGGQGTILKTTNGGEEWIPINAGLSATLHDGTYRRWNSTNYIFTVGDGGVISRTTSGGNEWSGTELSDQAGNLNSIVVREFDNALHGWISTESGAIYRCINLQDDPAEWNWFAQETGTRESLHDITVRVVTGAMQESNFVAWACGRRGTILYNPLYEGEGEVVSTDVVATHPTAITGVTLTADLDSLDGSGHITFYVSNNRGDSWTQIDELGVFQPIPVSSGCDCNTLAWRAELSTDNLDFSPAIFEVRIDYQHGYETSGTYASPIYDFGSAAQQRRFQAVTWASTVPEGTSLHLWGDLYDADRNLLRSIDMGTSGSYTFDLQSLLSVGNQFRYRVVMQTGDMSATPELTQVVVQTAYLSSGRAKPENRLTAVNIKEWDRVIVDLAEFNPPTHSLEMLVFKNGAQIFDLPPLVYETGRVTRDVSGIPTDGDLNVELRLSTASGSTTPRINRLTITYQSYSQTYFVDENGNSRTKYNLGEPICGEVVDRDANTDPTSTQTVPVTFSCDETGDVLVTTLTELGINSERFRGCILQEVNPVANVEDAILQVVDGATIRVRYVDPEDPEDQSEDQARIGQAEKGVSFIDENGNPVDRYDVTDSVCVEVIDPEANLSPVAIDSVDVLLYNDVTLDTLFVWLFETGNDTGVFRGCIETEINPIRDLADRKLQIYDDSDIGVIYCPDSDPDNCETDRVPVGGNKGSFVDDQGDPVDRYNLGDPVCVEVLDNDANINPVGVDSIDVVLFCVETLDTLETILYETGVNTGWFSGCIDIEVNPIRNLADDTLQVIDGAELGLIYCPEVGAEPCVEDRAIYGGAGENYAGDAAFKDAGFANLSGDEICLNRDLYLQVEDDTTTMNPDRTLDASLYVASNPNNILAVTLVLDETDREGITSPLRAYFRAQLPWSQVQAALNLQLDDSVVLAYADANDGDADPDNNIKTAQVRVTNCDVPVEGGYLIVFPNPYKETDEGTDPVFEYRPKGLATLDNLTMTIYNIAAEEVRRVGLADFEACTIRGGALCFAWDKTNNNGKAVSSGTYFAVVEATGGGKSDRQTVKLFLVR